MRNKSTESENIPIWRNITFRSYLFQLILLLGVILFFYFLYSNFQKRTASSPVELSYDFLDNRAGFDITGSNFDNDKSLLQAFIVGTLNTIRLVVPGLLLTTTVGIIVGIGRLSKNYLIKTASSFYVEAVRNIPLLVFAVIIYFGFVLNIFPRFNSAEDNTVLTAWKLMAGNIIISRRGVDIPWFSGSKILMILLLALAASAWWVAAKWRTTLFEQTGRTARSFIWGLSSFLIVFIIGWFAVGFKITTPEIIPDPNTSAVVKTTGGINMSSGYFAMLMALTIYTSSHVAEIIRGSIQSVHKGQSEAATALALSGLQRMRYVILPQALRTAIPPLGNQYLNLMKNSSLAGVVAYFDLTAVARTAVGGNAPAIPAFTFTMFIYLLFSLTISLLINFYNRKMKLVTR